MLARAPRCFLSLGCSRRDQGHCNELHRACINEGAHKENEKRRITGIGHQDSKAHTENKKGGENRQRINESRF